MIALWLATVAFSALAVYAAAVIGRGRPWGSRALPANVFRVATGVAFAGCVHVSLGVLAALAAFWWLRFGYTNTAGGTFWPLIAMALWMGLQAPDWGLSVALALLLASGVAEVAIGLCQAFSLPVFLHPTMIHGTLGHRTGYGIYLAVLMPLAFLTDWGWGLAGSYAIGIALSRSSVAGFAALVGLCVVVPQAWGLGVALAGLAFALRAIERDPASWCGLKWNHVAESFSARRAIWMLTFGACLRWPYWLIGHGAQSFWRYARRWVKPGGQLREHYTECHNDYLEFAFEYGVIGVLAAVVWLWQYGSFAAGDPVTGSAASLGVAMLANFPARVAPIATVGLVLAIMLMRRAA